MSYIVSGTLFTSDGVTAVQSLAMASNIQWLDSINETGSFSFSITVEDAPSLAVGQIVKFALGASSSDYVWAGVVESISLNQVGSGSDGVARTYQVSGRGVRALLEGAVVYNVGASATRTFTSVKAGAIMKGLIDAAQGRGALTSLTYDFTNTHDSNGDAFTETLTLDEPVGTTLLSVAAKHQELAVDVWVDPNLVVKYVNTRGEDLTIGNDPNTAVVLRVGQNVGEVTKQISGPVRNTILVALGTAGTDFATQQNGASVSTYGRQETFLSLSNTTDATVRQLSTTHIFNASANPTDGLTAQVLDTGALPYIDFEVGDTIDFVDLEGTRTAYRVRSVSVSVDDSGRVSFVPELGTTRPDLTRRLALALSRVESNNSGSESEFASGSGTSGLGGTGGESAAEFVYGEVLTYDPLTGLGTIDVDGTTYDFYNGTFFDLSPGDIVLGGGGPSIDAGNSNIGGADYAVLGVLESGGGYAGGYPGGSNTATVVPVSAVPGLPYTTGGQFSFIGTADGCVWSDAGTITDYTTPTTFTINRPSTSWDRCWGLSRSANGPWVFVNRGVTSNGLHIVYNGTGTTSNYGACQTLGTHNGYIWVWAGYKGGVTDRRIIGISSTGTIAYDFTSTNLNTLNTSVNTTTGRAGGWGIVLWDDADVVTIATPSGTPAYTQYAAINFMGNINRPGQADSLARTCISDTNFFVISTTTNDRDWRRWEFGTAARYDYLDVLPAGFTHDRIATLGGTTVVISGDTGTEQAYCITNGGAVTTTTFTGTVETEVFALANNPAYEVLAKTRADTAPNADTLIGVTA